MLSLFNPTLTNNTNSLKDIIHQHNNTKLCHQTKDIIILKIIHPWDQATVGQLSFRLLNSNSNNMLSTLTQPRLKILLLKKLMEWSTTMMLLNYQLYLPFLLTNQHPHRTQCNKLVAWEWVE